MNSINYGLYFDVIHITNQVYSCQHLVSHKCCNLHYVIRISLSCTNPLERLRVYWLIRAATDTAFRVNRLILISIDARSIFDQPPTSICHNPLGRPYPRVRARFLARPHSARKRRSQKLLGCSSGETRHGREQSASRSCRTLHLPPPPACSVSEKGREHFIKFTLIALNRQSRLVDNSQEESNKDQVRVQKVKAR